MSTQFDAIVIGTGAGGGTLAMHLAKAGKNILILERGSFMPQEKLNWDTSAVFLDNRYHTKEVWRDKDGKDLHPQQAYFVGGQTKVYGAAMFRMRAEDFGVIQHKGGHLSGVADLVRGPRTLLHTRRRALSRSWGSRYCASDRRWIWLILRSNRAVSLEALSLSGFFK